MREPLEESCARKDAGSLSERRERARAHSRSTCARRPISGADCAFEFPCASPPAPGTDCSWTLSSALALGAPKVGQPADERSLAHVLPGQEPI